MAKKQASDKQASNKQVLSLGWGSDLKSLPPHYQGWDLVAAQDTQSAPGMDLRQLSSQPAAQHDAVYCAHPLQTMYTHEVGSVFLGIKHVLKPDGFVEIRVRDVGAVMRVAVERNLDLEDELFKSAAGPVTVRDAIYGHARDVLKSPDQFAHRVGFSRQSLRGILGHAGFAAAALLRPRSLEIAIVGFLSLPSDQTKAMLKLRA